MTKRWSAKAFERVAVAVMLGLSVVACGGEDDDDADDGHHNPPAETHLEITGAWENKDFMETDVIDDTSWTTTFGDSDPLTSTIEKFDNTGNVVIYAGQDGKYSRIVWTEIEDDAFFFCTVDYGLETLEDAEASEKTADDSDPENGGCGDGGFSWTKLTKQ